MAQIRTRKRGKTYSYIFEAGIVNGKRKVVEKGGFASKDDAYNAGVAAFTDFKHGNIGILSENISLRDYIDNWLNGVCAINVRESTLVQYQKMIKYHITPLIGDIDLQDLTPAMLDKWIRQLTRKGLAYKSLKLILAILRQALNYAVYPGNLIQSNPALYIKIPRIAPRDLIERKIITPDEFTELMKDFPAGHVMHIPTLLLYNTGMRVAEVAGLRWQDIDLKKMTISVNQQIRYISKDKKYCLTPPKTNSSKRTFTITPELVKELSAWKIEQAKNEMAAGSNYIGVYAEPDGTIHNMSKIYANGIRIDLVCTKANGHSYPADSIRKQLNAKGYNSHSFRHSHATLLVEAGATLKGVANRLGQSTTQMTEQVYTHATKKMDLDTAALFGKIMQTK
ncbi:tyrosine recombinase XerC [Selenomonas sp. AE3005]|uniref:site-specific integrase n=1 Tax=Selenomonas sp. AE3005 TaxID=1485543 RepID=UPI0025E058DF|nr:site-specific integrase [Selenomonas sp. AE3005]